GFLLSLTMPGDGNVLPEFREMSYYQCDNPEHTLHIELAGPYHAYVGTVEGDEVVIDMPLSMERSVRRALATKGIRLVLQVLTEKQLRAMGIDPKPEYSLDVVKDRFPQLAGHYLALIDQTPEPTPEDDL